jgi:ribosomal protection tetracycline resistance protein
VSQTELNLGILAHVDAGKTTLTERLLYETGAIRAPGSVDAGTTVTDSLELERQRGITIRSAVASFAVGGAHVNLIDTPGHPDFIAEVERVLGVLDGAVLVLSAVEGVQAQTRVLMRALQRLRVPTLLFVNKIDRAGAGDERVLEAIAGRLAPAIVAMCRVGALGTAGARVTAFGERDGDFRLRLAEVLSERDDAILTSFVEDESRLPFERLREALAAQTRGAHVHPVFFGSARTGAGVEELLRGIRELLPRAAGDAGGPRSGTVFKIERGRGGERVAYVRMTSGTIRTRDRVRFGAGHEGKVTAIEVFGRGGPEPRPSVSAGGVARLRGLDDVRIGDRLGGGTAETTGEFAPPTLEAVVTVDDRADRPRLHAALVQLAEQDPLIGVRHDETGELSVSLYGEVQGEVLGATLAREYGLEVELREATPIHVERPLRAGTALEPLGADTNPFSAGVGLGVEPAPPGSGVEFRLAVPTSTLPLHAYGKRGEFEAAVARHVRTALEEGLLGWAVTDCVVTMTHCAYASADGPPSTRGSTSPADYRKLVPLVLTAALERAGTAVCEPMLRVEVELPTDAIGTALPMLTRLGASVGAPAPRGQLATVEVLLPARRAQELRRRLPGATAGEGVAHTSFGGYRPVAGPPPARSRTRPSPLDRGAYLRWLAGRPSARGQGEGAAV